MRGLKKHLLLPRRRESKKYFIYIFLKVVMFGGFKSKVKKVKQKRHFIVKAAEFALSILEDKLNLQIECEFDEPLPNDRPILFVANHFTRAETMIMPYILKQHLGSLIRTLADKQIFRSHFLQNFLHKAKVVSTGDANRDDIIIADLLTGNEKWMIYPEGKMLKDKNIFVNFSSLGSEITTSARTGSAVLALKTEIMREKLLFNNAEAANVNLDGLVHKKGVVIVPISISYHPLNFEENWLETLIKQPIKRLSPSMNEELRIETSILTNAKIDLHFAKPIEVSDFIEKERRKFSMPNIFFGFRNDEQKDGKNDDFVLGNKLLPSEQKIIQKARHELTGAMMKAVYDNILITPSHFYAAIVHYFVSKSILQMQIIDFKNILCYCYFLVGDKFSQTHRFEKFENEFEFLISKDMEIITKNFVNQNLIKIEGEEIFFQAENINATPDFHQIRIQNLMRVHYNELCYFATIKQEIERLCLINFTKINQYISRRLYELDLQSFESDYAKFFNIEETKSKKITSPFFLASKNGSVETGIVLSHGYKSAPEEMRLLAEYLAANNINVYVVRLKGHGTGSENMKHITNEQWVESVQIGFEFLSRKCKKVYMGGFSTGGLVSLFYAYQNQHLLLCSKQIAGLVCINAALKIADIKFKFVRFAKFGVDLINKFRSEQNKMGEYVLDEPENPHINYNKNYLNGLNELSKLIEKVELVLGKITTPAYIVQASNDPVINPESGNLIFEKIASANKQIYKPQRSRHVIVRGNGCEQIFEKIFTWIQG